MWCRSLPTHSRDHAPVAEVSLLSETPHQAAVSHEYICYFYQEFSKNYRSCIVIQILSFVMSLEFACGH